MSTPQDFGLSMKARIRAGFAVILSIMVILTAFGILRVNSIDKILVTIADVTSIKQRQAINLRGSVHDRAVALRDVVLANSDDEVKGLLTNINRLFVDYEKAVVALDKIFVERSDSNVDDRTILNSIKESEARTLPIIQSVIALRQSGNIDGAKEMMLNTLRPAFTEWLGRINQFNDFQENMIQKESALARDVAHGFQAVMFLMCVIALIVGTVVATLITRMIFRAVGCEPAVASNFARSIAAGDLSASIQLRRNDHSSVLYAMNDMREGLLKIVAEVRNGADTIAAASGQIAAGNLDLSTRTEQQASSLEETASSMEELTSTVKQNADNAYQANQLALSASDVALKGGAVVSQVVETMGSINASSRKIVDIIAVIDSIAFQTNILALNAAVEAARAGEQGRGFAVVASEVRNLAQRSAAAAKEIKVLIGDSVEKVDAGTQLVDRAGATMGEIVESIKRVTDIMGEIAAASKEQTAGIGQINQAITHMDDVTQQNASLVEQAAAAAQSLQDQAGVLAQAVSVFKLDAAYAGKHSVIMPRKAPVARLAVAERHVRQPVTGGRALKSAPSAPASGTDWEEF